MNFLRHASAIWITIASLCYHFTRCQRVIDLHPQTVLTTGGQVLTIFGSELELLPSPVTIDFIYGDSTSFKSEECTNTTMDILLCRTPTPLPLPPGEVIPDTGAELLTGLGLTVRLSDVSPLYDLLVYTPPTLQPDASRSFTLWTRRDLTIRGTNLLFDGTLDVRDYRVTVGDNSSCDIMQMTSDVILCLLPTLPPVLGEYIDVKVVIGAFQFLERRVMYRVPFFPEEGKVYEYNPLRRVGVQVPGKYLLVAVNESDYSIQIGQGLATRLDLNPSSATFFPPDKQPTPLADYPLHPDRYPQIVITVPVRRESGSLNETRFPYVYQYHVGYVRYFSASDTPTQGGGGSTNITSSVGSNVTDSVTIFPGSTTSDVTSASDEDENEALVPALVAFFSLLVVSLGILICCCWLCSGCTCPRWRRPYSNKTVVSEETSTEEEEPVVLRAVPVVQRVEPVLIRRIVPFGTSWWPYRSS